jgi:hypothetical protein
VTPDEELNILEDSLRRLKIEYDIYFGGGAKKPPADLEWKVQNLVKKYSDGNKMNFAQRFRYNTISQRYALYNSLWQQKNKIKEEGYRRPQDAVLGIAGMRIDEEHAAAEALAKKNKAAKESENLAFKAALSDVNAEGEGVQKLFNAMMAARAKSGDNGAANFDSFKSFVQKKTEQIRKEYGCHAVEYSVEMENGQVKLKAKAKI